MTIEINAQKIEDMLAAPQVEREDYQAFVKNLFKAGPAILADLSLQVDPAALGRLHAVIGMVGECHELQNATSKENWVEEMGDIAFYFEALTQSTDWWVVLERYKDQFNANLTMLDISCELLDLCKKETMYAKPLDGPKQDRFYVLMSSFIEVFENTLNEWGSSMQEIARHNVEKLGKKRYPGAVYSNEAAAARLDKIGEE